MMVREDERVELPREPIHRVVGPLERFLHVEAASGIVLLFCSSAALMLANSPAGEAFAAVWDTRISFGLGPVVVSHSLKHWINDGLMTLFFFVVGLEVKRELVLGELREWRRAALPFFAALGGILAPAGIYLWLQQNGAAQQGWGIPMATDIAFVVGCMAVLSGRIPASLRVLLLSVAIVDDIGAILVIAIAYTEQIGTTALGLGLAGLALVFGLGRLGVRSFLPYALIGVAVWFCFHESGLHATLAGVALGLLTPVRTYLSPATFRDFLDRAGDLLHGGAQQTLQGRADRVRLIRRATREAISPLEYLEGALHPWVGFLIMPVFALANAGVAFEPSDLGHPVALAVAAGLVLGKPVGVLLLSWVGVRLGLARLPEGVSWGVLSGGACLMGIGFTMALFIAEVALEGVVLQIAKIGVLGGSALSAALGMSLLWRLLPAAPASHEA
jgi:NhaA family Na+:H+ antiporter